MMKGSAIPRSFSLAVSPAPEPAVSPVPEFGTEDEPPPGAIQSRIGKGLTRPTGRKRLNFEFPHHVAHQLDAYAEATGRSKTEFLRLAIGTYAILCDELMKGNRVFITGPDAKRHLRELVLPA